MLAVRNKLYRYRYKENQEKRFLLHDLFMSRHERFSKYR